ncbi:CaiB/BaiF CoA-transferase family protein [Azospirillum sp. TSA6c]|uniref:CaiB/BaiF CoA transferase family protein n=1 Tax=unclassified Azospirillum TaxID=2630922 RepID=UPI000D6513FF|nr:CaiB/BaiF CoA-transferase family protein [Azospirillum sp. TSA6c]
MTVFDGGAAPDAARSLGPLHGGPLHGIRVLDLSRVLAGPWCTQCLADLGAQVLKIESPGDGDETRSWGPPYMGDLAAYYTCANRSKHSLTVDLKSAEGQRLVRDLAAEADILIENFKLGTLDRFGLGYEDLKPVNPALIYCSVSGYGRTGPEAARAGYDFVIQGETGLMSVTGFPDGPPTKVGVAVSDLFSGLYASQAILAALLGRQQTGRGQFLDVALFDCQLAAMANVAAGALATGAESRRYGNAHPNVVPYEVFETSDGPFVLAIGNDRQFRTLCESVLEDIAMRDDPAFRTNADRVANRVLLSQRLAARFRERPRAHWMERLAARSLPAGAVRSVVQALASDQVAGRNLLHSFETAGGGPIRVVGYPVKFEDGLPPPGRPPAQGEGGGEIAKQWLESRSGAGRTP